MMIVDVVRRLNTEGEICFLLSAYLETLQFHSPSKYLPPGVTTLPLKDADDIEARFSNLLGAEFSGIGHAHGPSHGAIAREATEIFSVACARVQALREAAEPVM